MNPRSSPALKTLPGDENEGEKSNLESLLKKEDKKGLTAEAVACDALYDSLANRLNMGEKRNETLHSGKEKEEKTG